MAKAQRQKKQEPEKAFPWGEVDAARRNLQLQGRHPVLHGKDPYLSRAAPCPKCGTEASRLAWFYFETPTGKWKINAGRSGWMTVCDPCHLQVDFFLDLAN